MYIIYSERAHKALKVWSCLAPTAEHTALVEGIRAGMAPAYPDDRLVVMHDAVASSSVAEREFAAMSPEDRAVAQRVADLDEIEPAEGYEERAVERARRDGVL